LFVFSLASCIPLMGWHPNMKDRRKIIRGHLFVLFIWLSFKID